MLPTKPSWCPEIHAYSLSGVCFRVCTRWSRSVLRATGPHTHIHTHTMHPQTARKLLACTAARHVTAVAVAVAGTRHERARAHDTNHHRKSASTSAVRHAAPETTDRSRSCSPNTMAQIVFGRVTEHTAAGHRTHRTAYTDDERSAGAELPNRRENTVPGSSLVVSSVVRARLRARYRKSIISCPHNGHKL